MTLLPILTFTELRIPPMEHFQRVWHSSRERLLLRTPDPVPFWNLQILFCWDHWHSFIHYTTNSWPFPWFDFLPNLTPFLDLTPRIYDPFSDFTSYWMNLTLLNVGFHWASATGVACRQGTLTLPETLFRSPFLGLAYAPIIENSFPELAATFRLEYPRYFLDFALDWTSLTFVHCMTCMYVLFVQLNCYPSMSSVI